MHPALTIEHQPPSRVGIWVAAGFGLYVVMGVASLFAVATFENLVAPLLGLQGEAGTTSWGYWLAVHPVVWGISTALASAWLGRRLMPDIRFRTSGAAMLAVGLALAAATTFLVHEFVRARYSVYDPEYAGFVVFAAPTLVAIGLAAWALAATPQNGRWIAKAALIAAVGSLAFAVVPSLPGVRDGIEPASLPLAIVLGLAALYAGASLAFVAVSAIRRAA